jgi:hypothetical protein
VQRIFGLLIGGLELCISILLRLFVKLSKISLGAGMKIRVVALVNAFPTDGKAS